MNKRRAPGDGSVYQIKTGKHAGWYRASIELGKDADGVRRRMEIQRKTRAAVRAELDRLKLKKISGELPGAGSKRITVKAYLEAWLADLARNGRAPSTVLRYGTIARRQLIPQLGAVRLADLDAERAERLYRRLGAQGESASAIRKAHAVLHSAIADAIPTYLARNPLDQLARGRRPKYKADERHEYSLKEIRAFLKVAKGDPFEALYLIALFSQAREGEIFALRRSDVDLRAGAIFVRSGLQDQTHSKREIATTKTEAARRRVDLPAIAAAALRAHLAPAAVLKRGAGGSELVFPDERGGPLSRHNFLRRQLYPLMDRAQLRRITFHDLRHSGATLLASQIPLVALKERLGHTSTRMTERYVHRTPSLGALAVDALDELFPAKMAGPKAGPGGNSSARKTGTTSRKARRS